LNGVVAPGRAPIAANSPVTMQTVENLTGLTPQQYADAASSAVGEAPGFFYWGGFDDLSVGLLGAKTLKVPITVNPGFRTPNTRALPFGLQRALTSNLVAYVDLFHKDIRNVLGVRITNLAFEARLPGHTGETVPGTGDQLINSYGPWFNGQYDAAIVGFRNRMSRRFTSGPKPAARVTLTSLTLPSAMCVRIRARCALSRRASPATAASPASTASARRPASVRVTHRA